MTSNIEIPYSKNHLYFSFLIFDVFYYFPIQDLYKNGFTYDSPTIFLLPMATIMLILFMIRFGIPTIKGDSALELTSAGIIDKVRNRTIYWQDIDSFDSGSTNTSSVIIVNLKDPTRYQPSTYLGYIPYWLSKITFGSPVIIGTKFIDIKASDLISEISSYREKNSELTQRQQ